MKVNVTQPCPSCKGNKKQVHPTWQELFNRRDHEPELKASDFFLEREILTAAERPPVVIDCTNCKGAGEVATWVPVNRFLELVQQARLSMYKLLGGAPL